MNLYIKNGFKIRFSDPFESMGCIQHNYGIATSQQEYGFFTLI